MQHRPHDWNLLVVASLVSPPWTVDELNWTRSPYAAAGRHVQMARMDSGFTDFDKNTFFPLYDNEPNCSVHSFCIEFSARALGAASPLPKRIEKGLAGGFRSEEAAGSSPAKGKHSRRTLQNCSKLP